MSLWETRHVIKVGFELEMTFDLQVPENNYRHVLLASVNTVLDFILLFFFYENYI